MLDDGATVTYNATTAYPWLTLTNTVRAGANATFVTPVVLDYRFASWRLQPASRIQPGSDGSGQVAFEQDRPAAPDDVEAAWTLMHGTAADRSAERLARLTIAASASASQDSVPAGRCGSTR